MTNVLFVCLGNICRSPMAEAIFKDLVEKRASKTKSKWIPAQPVAKKKVIRPTQAPGK